LSFASQLDRSQFTLLHEERGHWFLSGALLNQIIRLTLLLLVAEIRLLGFGVGRFPENGQIIKRKLTSPVQVPLAATGQPTTLLEGLCRRLSNLVFLSNPVEEVYAVWSSLTAGEQAGLFSSRGKKSANVIIKIDTAFTLAISLSCMINSARLPR
jgi:hypothetical protein